MGEIPTSLKWLHSQETELKWVLQYIEKTASTELRRRFEHEQTDRERNRYQNIIAGIHAMESTQAGPAYISRLRNALRQRKYRTASNGRKAYTFALPTELGRRLDQLAKGAGWRKGEVVEDMMGEHARLQAEHRRTIALLGQRHKTDLVNAETISLTWQERYKEAMKQIEQLAYEVARLSLRQKSSPPSDVETEDALVSKAAKKIVNKSKRAIQEGTQLLAFTSGIAPATFDPSEPLDDLPQPEEQEQEQEQEQPEYGPEYGPEDPENDKAP